MAQLTQLQEATTTKKFWQEIKKFKSAPFIPNGITEEQWKQFYETQMPPRAPLTIPTSTNTDSELDQSFTIAEVSEALKKTSNNKTSGPDGINNEFWKHLPEESIAQLTHEAWFTSETVMLHKKGRVDDPVNFRPIALANTAMKIFTSVLAERISTWAEVNEKLPEAQGVQERKKLSGANIQFNGSPPHTFEMPKKESLRIVC